MSIELIDHEPIATRTGLAFVDWRDDSAPYGLSGGVREVTTPVYTRSEDGEKLRRWRIASHLTLAEVARRAGISVSDALGLEYGRCSPKCGWERLKEVVNG